MLFQKLKDSMPSSDWYRLEKTIFKGQPLPENVEDASLSTLLRVNNTLSIKNDYREELYNSIAHSLMNERNRDENINFLKNMPESERKEFLSLNKCEKGRTILNQLCHTVVDDLKTRNEEITNEKNKGRGYEADWKVIADKDMKLGNFAMNIQPVIATLVLLKADINNKDQNGVTPLASIERLIKKTPHGAVTMPGRDTLSSALKFPQRVVDLLKEKKLAINEVKEPPKNELKEPAKVIEVKNFNKVENTGPPKLAAIEQKHSTAVMAQLFNGGSRDINEIKKGFSVKVTPPPSYEQSLNPKESPPSYSKAVSQPDSKVFMAPDPPTYEENLNPKEPPPSYDQSTEQKDEVVEQTRPRRP